MEFIDQLIDYPINRASLSCQHCLASIQFNCIVCLSLLYFGLDGGSYCISVLVLLFTLYNRGVDEFTRHILVKKEYVSHTYYRYEACLSRRITIVSAKR